MKVLAVDYGRARTGIAVSDATGTLARPLDVIERVRSRDGMQRLLACIEQQQPELLVVGLPLTLRGQPGEQARETLAFVEQLRAGCPVPVETYDERFTTPWPSGRDRLGTAPMRWPLPTCSRGI